MPTIRTSILKAIAKTCSKDTSRSSLACIHVVTRAGHLVVEASDSARVTRYEELTDSTRLMTDGEWLVPPKALTAESFTDMRPEWTLDPAHESYPKVLRLFEHCEELLKATPTTRQAFYPALLAGTLKVHADIAKAVKHLDALQIVDVRLADCEAVITSRTEDDAVLVHSIVMGVRKPI